MDPPQQTTDFNRHSFNCPPSLVRVSFCADNDHAGYTWAAKSLSTRPSSFTTPEQIVLCLHIRSLPVNGWENTIMYTPSLSGILRLKSGGSLLYTSLKPVYLPAGILCTLLRTTVESRPEPDKRKINGPLFAKQFLVTLWCKPVPAKE